MVSIYSAVDVPSSPLVRWWVSMKLSKDLCTTVCACFQMAIIFNQEGLKAVRPPCVIQSFINHNAVLYKVFVVGESYTVVKRPSLKNFSAGISGTLCRFKRKWQFSEPWQQTAEKKNVCEKAAEGSCFLRTVFPLLYYFNRKRDNTSALEYV